MSRHADAGFDDDYLELSIGRWDHNLRTAIAGKRCQKILREMREALLALPQRRLIAGDLATPDGEVCAVGALAAHKRAIAQGTPIVDAAKALAAQDPIPWQDYERQPDGSWVRTLQWPDGRARITISHGEGEDNLPYTLAVGEWAGLVETLAQKISYLNDETWEHCTPEQRWQKALDWVDSKIEVAT